MVWRFETEKKLKIPYYINGSKRHYTHGSFEDVEQLATFEAAKNYAAKKGYDGIGLALLETNNITVIDIDKCQNNMDEVQQLLGDTYIEYSPSGNGLHAIYSGNLQDAKSFSGDFGFEVFSNKGYVTYTNNTLIDADIKPIPASIRSYYSKLFASKKVERNEFDDIEFELSRNEYDKLTIVKALKQISPDIDYDSWVKIGMALHHNFGDDGFEIWDKWSKNGEKYDGKLQQHWRSFDISSGNITCATILEYAKKQPISDDQIKAEPSKFPVHTLDDFCNFDQLEWDIKKILPSRSLATMYGESGSGKSFVGLDMAMKLASGEPWRGRKTKKSRVMYLVAEGGRGFKSRPLAYKQEFGVDINDLDLFVMPATPDITNKDDVIHIINAVKTWECNVLIVDTLAQVMAGHDECSFSEMSITLKHCQKIIEHCDCTVLLIHHSGKDKTKGSRGHSVLKTNVDAEIEITREEDFRKLKVTKLKDDEDGAEFGFQLEQVILGFDEDGDEISSCVVRECEIQESKVNVKKLGTLQKEIYQELDKLIPTDESGIAVASVIEDCLHLVSEHKGNGRDTRWQKIKRSLNSLLERDDIQFYIKQDYIHRGL